MNQVILAPAGGRKTQRIVEMCSNLSTPKKRAVITYTTTAQRVLVDRLLASDAREQMPTVMGWYTFLLDHVVRPYASSIPELKDRRIKGLHLVTESLSKWLSGAQYYLTNAGDVYNERLGLLASKVIEADREAVIDRIEHLFDEIYIDEIQDLRGNDLDILDELLMSKIRIIMVGDIRQRLLSTSRSSTKYKQYDGLGLVQWFKDRADKGILDLQEIRETWRCCTEVIEFADQMFHSEIFPPTVSNVIVPQGMHYGVWLVKDDDVEEYISRFHPARYRDSVKTKLVGTDSATNFGLCKGETKDHVLIFPTNPMKRFWKDKTNELPARSRMNTYVAITRARWSAAICVDSTKGYDIPVWCPDSSK